VGNGRGGCGFGQEPFGEGRVVADCFGQNDFDRALRIVHRVTSKIHGTNASLTDSANQVIAIFQKNIKRKGWLCGVAVVRTMVSGVRKAGLASGAFSHEFGEKPGM
jgi:hypothetical protein